jgi:hypothetical protein
MDKRPLLFESPPQCWWAISRSAPERPGVCGVEYRVFFNDVILPRHTAQVDPLGTRPLQAPAHGAVWALSVPI